MPRNTQCVSIVATVACAFKSTTACTAQRFANLAALERWFFSLLAASSLGLRLHSQNATESLKSLWTIARPLLTPNGPHTHSNDNSATLQLTVTTVGNTTARHYWEGDLKCPCRPPELSSALPTTPPRSSRTGAEAAPRSRTNCCTPCTPRRRHRRFIARAALYKPTDS